MSRPRPPTAREQLAFLRSLQRLMDEGSFVASYKFALLHAIADLCLIKGDDSGAELELYTSEIAEQFVRLYWPQVVPYPASAEQQILSQNTGRQAAIVREVAEQRARYQGSLADLERSHCDPSTQDRRQYLPTNPGTCRLPAGTPRYRMPRSRR